MDFFFFLDFHEKVLILRDFSISVYLFKFLIMKVLRWWAFSCVKVNDFMVVLLEH